MSKVTIQGAIDTQIVANGLGLITGPMVHNILTDMVAQSMSDIEAPYGMDSAREVIFQGEYGDYFGPGVVGYGSSVRTFKDVLINYAFSDLMVNPYAVTNDTKAALGVKAIGASVASFAASGDTLDSFVNLSATDLVSGLNSSLEIGSQGLMRLTYLDQVIFIANGLTQDLTIAADGSGAELNTLNLYAGTLNVVSEAFDIMTTGHVNIEDVPSGTTLSTSSLYVKAMSMKVPTLGAPMNLGVFDISTITATPGRARAGVNWVDSIGGNNFMGIDTSEGIKMSYTGGIFGDTELTVHDWGLDLMSGGASCMAAYADTGTLAFFGVAGSNSLIENIAVPVVYTAGNSYGVNERDMLNEYKRVISAMHTALTRYGLISN